MPTPSAASWTALRVEVPPDAADLVATFLVEEGAPGVLVDEPDAEGRPVPPGRVRIEAHVPEADAARVSRALAAYLGALRAVLPLPAGIDVEQRAVPALDWPAVFAAHHRPRSVGKRLLVAPPWDVPRIPGRTAIVVEPGQAFGTGQHATTRACLVEIEAAADAGARSGLDVGTGSGVLAAAMRRLGLARVVATDIDRAVLPMARETCRRNGVHDALLLAGRADAVRGAFDLVVANLLAEALRTDAAIIAARVAPGGRLVLAGLLTEQVDEVLPAYPGWRLAHVHAEDAWRTLRLERRAG